MHPVEETQGMHSESMREAVSLVFQEHSEPRRPELLLSILLSPTLGAERSSYDFHLLF